VRAASTCIQDRLIIQGSIYIKVRRGSARIFDRRFQSTTKEPIWTQILCALRGQRRRLLREKSRLEGKKSGKPEA